MGRPKISQIFTYIWLRERWLARRRKPSSPPWTARKSTFRSSRVVFLFRDLERENLFKRLYAFSKQIKYSFRNALNFLKRTYRKEGFFALYRGNTATLARIIPYSASQFASFEQFRKLLNVDNSPDPHFRRFLAGSLAGITSQSVTYPLDLARARMAITNKCGNKYVHLLRWRSLIFRQSNSYLSFFVQKHLGSVQDDLRQGKRRSISLPRFRSYRSWSDSVCGNFVLHLWVAQTETFRWVLICSVMSNQWVRSNLFCRIDWRQKSECAFQAFLRCVCRNLRSNQQLSFGWERIEMKSLWLLFNNDLLQTSFEGECKHQGLRIATTTRPWGKRFGKSTSKRESFGDSTKDCRWTGWKDRWQWEFRSRPTIQSSIISVLSLTDREWS